LKQLDIYRVDATVFQKKFIPLERDKMKRKNQKVPDIPVMILCGGKGTRLREVTEVLPKPMVPIGNQPILWHIMKNYAAFGLRRFILCLGYKQEVFSDYFMNFHLRLSDATITLGHDPDICFHKDVEEADWQVTLAQTGIESKTGLRVIRASQYLKETDEDFFLTYGDGLSDVDIGALYRFHKENGKALTVSAVHPPARFGEMVLEGEQVKAFTEKPIRSQSYINGGFMVMKKEFLARYLSPAKDEFLEQAPMQNCVADSQVAAFRHEGFWQCMDTPREYTLLNDLWEKKKAPWTRFWR
jgi:glucose-1-phosphate cytidylyltransferase